MRKVICEAKNAGDFEKSDRSCTNDGKFTNGGNGTGSIKSDGDKRAKKDNDVKDDTETQKRKQEIIGKLDKDYLNTASQFFDEAKGKIKQRKEKVYRKVDKAEAEKIKQKTGLDVEGYEHKIINEDLAHIYKRHGNPKIEAKNNHVVVTADDIKLIPEITKNYDSVELSKERAKSDGRPVLIYKKRIGNEYYCLETVGGKAKDLRLRTMYIKEIKTG
ncbi:MAG: hypothetical protein LBK68_00425 [Candidatus Margulisbacteria bacterium]|jgi:hypothetical protein|nr:hypothetical protein [Candidatus Margulisiibacteriota bacterium]